MILPRCNTAAINLLMPSISAKVAPGRHAGLLMDQAGWHLSAKLRVPAKITVLPLLPTCPELNPAENFWEFMRDNWPSNRIFTCYHNILDHCGDVLNKPTYQPWRIMSLGLRDWAHGFQS